MKRPKPIKKITGLVKRRRTPSIKEMVRELSAGGVVYRHNKKGEVEILMIQDDKDRWSVPKGKKDNDKESLKEIAEREVREETGLKEMKVMGWLGKVNFRFRRKNSLVLKTMHVFLVKAEGDTEKIRPEKGKYWVKEVKWFPAMDALDKIEYDEVGKLILLALKKLRAQGKR